jgi:hypothetical protein
MCKGKIQFPDEYSARIKMQELISKGKFRYATGKRLQVYKCPTCTKYHFGHADIDKDEK